MGRVRLLAGGTDLLVMIKQGRLVPEFVVSLKDVPGLSYVREQKRGGLRIGAMTPLREMERSPLLQSKYPPSQRLQDGSAPPSSLAATIGGNLCNGAPSADLAPLWFALEPKPGFKGNQRESFLLKILSWTWQSGYG